MINMCILTGIVFQSLIDASQQKEHNLLPIWLICPEFHVKVKVVYYTTVEDTPSNLYQDRLQTRFVSTKNGGLEVFSACMNGSLVAIDMRSKVHDSTHEAIVRFSLSNQ